MRELLCACLLVCVSACPAQTPAGAFERAGEPRESILPALTKAAAATQCWQLRAVPMLHIPKIMIGDAAWPRSAIFTVEAQHYQ